MSKIPMCALRLICRSMNVDKKATLNNGALLSLSISEL